MDWLVELIWVDQPIHKLNTGMIMSGILNIEESNRIAIEELKSNSGFLKLFLGQQPALGGTFAHLDTLSDARAREIASGLQNIEELLLRRYLAGNSRDETHFPYLFFYDIGFHFEGYSSDSSLYQLILHIVSVWSLKLADEFWIDKLNALGYSTEILNEALAAVLTGQTTLARPQVEQGMRPHHRPT